ncbi:MAG: Hint domain-containing protein, partial [Rhodospirillales bacterium]|nr:Hint domain-containing protein [Rhodospirillales bacterium]
PQLASPLQEISFSQNVNAIQVTLLDANGAPFATLTDFSFFVSFASDGTFSGTVTEPNASCFGKGTLIATSLGTRPVEALRVGDLVLVERPGAARSLETIRWVGHRRMHLSSRSDAVLNAPVRIRAGAIGPSRPSRDLILSPDHCIHVDGHLLRAYRFINGASVVQEFPRAINYYHIETERHGLVFAEGLAVETYLEEECASFFPSRYARPDHRRDKVRQAACAPSAPDDGFAERAWRAVAQRAGVSTPEARLAPRPDVTLIAGKRRIRPTVHRNDRITFALPRACSEIRLLSPAARPTEARPWLEDRRLLGLNVRNLRMDAGDALPLDSDAIGRGWWPIEPGLSRWTDGDACVRLPAAARLLDVLLRA